MAQGETAGFDDATRWVVSANSAVSSARAAIESHKLSVSTAVPVEESTATRNHKGLVPSQLAERPRLAPHDDDQANCEDQLIWP